LGGLSPLLQICDATKMYQKKNKSGLKNKSGQPESLERVGFSAF
jgi:hypothetical protein